MPSQLIYAASCAWISLAGLSLSIFMVRVAHATSPVTSTIFFATAGSLSCVIFFFALVFRRISGPPQQPRAQPVAV
ncbi:hypothetical protein BOTBODRAFT_39881, partial [Botryobasidium botryosum FD-172 SS1]